VTIERWEPPYCATIGSGSPRSGSRKQLKLGMEDDSSKAEAKGPCATSAPIRL
jgi:hypothetical protein